LGFFRDTAKIFEMVKEQLNGKMLLIFITVRMQIVISGLGVESEGNF